MRLSEIKNIPTEEDLPTGGKFKYINGKPYSYIDENGLEHIPTRISVKGEHRSSGRIDRVGRRLLIEPGTLLWFNGERKLDSIGDQPALVSEDGTKIWFKNGKYHRIGKPAIIHPTGDGIYFENGKLLSE